MRLRPGAADRRKIGRRCLPPRGGRAPSPLPEDGSDRPLRPGARRARHPLPARPRPGGPQRAKLAAHERRCRAASRSLHGLDPQGCPFDHRLDRRITLAGARLEAGVVDEDDLDDGRKGRTAAELYGELLAKRPLVETLVVMHGDAYLDNILAEGGRFSGFVDCARLGLADSCQDLALVRRSIGGELGEEWINPFLRRYGSTAADEERLSYDCLLDEFF
ncbi:aminoglycoside 3'-phosphotransferase [Chelatococcus sp. SYSU_G07232]|uniref:Aminoglycoside 3'-phosphotransferase n=1 Tax=Chelatococcus albus TaxID=3047466 RepID=A0ABT7AGS6_9HYPH|nr:aminoglycoside 3'-phosphotransferase [Chelatococcus sp. SYSU_G07232]MDJ1158569.1 aminoglycoside 3'-phosphotransferase [Chelatococcus sp. SYSU_G07232]